MRHLTRGRGRVELSAAEGKCGAPPIGPGKSDEGRLTVMLEHEALCDYTKRWRFIFLS